MKRFLLALALSMLAFSASALQQIPIVSSTRVAGTVTSADMYVRDSGNGPRDKGLVISNNVTSVTGAVTMTFSLQAKNPSGAYYNLLTLTPVAPVVGTVNTLMVGPGITAAAGASAAIPLPSVFRVQAVTSSTGSVTYSIGVSRAN